MDMITLEQAYQAIDTLSGQVKKLFQITGFDGDSLEKVSHQNSPDDYFYMDELLSLLVQLVTIQTRIEYLHRPISTEGYLSKNDRGRYELNGYDLTCGCGIEILVTDEYTDMYKWVYTGIEHDGKDYYATRGRHDLNHRRARIRG